MNVVINAQKINMQIQKMTMKFQMNMNVKILVIQNIFMMKKKKYVEIIVKLDTFKFNIHRNVLNLVKK